MRCCFDNDEIDVTAATFAELVERAAEQSVKFRQGYVESDGRTLRARVLVVLDDALCDVTAAPAVKLSDSSVVMFMHQLAGG